MAKNIVFFIQDFSRPAGSERVTSLVANYLAQNGYNVTILSICGNNTSFYLIDEKIKLKTLLNKRAINNKIEFLKIIGKLKEYYTHNSTDIVIDVFAALSIYTLLLKRRFGYKSITWEHFNFKAKVGFNKIGRKLASRSAEYIITLTEQDKEFYVRAFPQMRAKITSIYNPSPFVPQQLFEDDKENLLISVGRLTYQKGFDELIEIWRLLSPSVPNWKLIIIGNGEEREKLVHLIETKQIKNIEIHPAVQNIGVWYRRAKIYLSTSRFEGLPMTMIEAQTFGLPIVSYDYLTGPKDIIQSEYNGLLIPVGERNKFVQKLNELMRDDQKIKILSQNSLVSSERFSYDKICEKWLSLIGSLI